MRKNRAGILWRISSTRTAEAIEDRHDPDFKPGEEEEEEGSIAEFVKKEGWGEIFPGGEIFGLERLHECQESNAPDIP
jgi:hypothetical protein